MDRRHNVILIEGRVNMGAPPDCLMPSAPHIENELIKVLFADEFDRSTRAYLRTNSCSPKKNVWYHCFQYFSTTRVREDLGWAPGRDLIKKYFVTLLREVWFQSCIDRDYLCMHLESVENMERDLGTRHGKGPITEALFDMAAVIRTRFARDAMIMSGNLEIPQMGVFPQIAPGNTSFKHLFRYYVICYYVLISNIYSMHIFISTSNRKRVPAPRGRHGAVPYGGSRCSGGVKNVGQRRHPQQTPSE
jgi:hypothetical protein